MEKGKLFYLIVALQVVFLIGMIGFKQSTVWFGEKVLLKPIPYDPTDILRGDFINIRYEISTIKLDSIKSDTKDFKRGDTIFVRLEKGKDFSSAAEVSTKKTAEPYIKGRVNDVYSKNVYTVKETNSSNNYIYEETIYDYEYSPVKTEQSFDVGDKVEFNEFNNRVNYLIKCQNGICQDQPDIYNQYKIGNVINVKKGIMEISIEYPIESYFVPKNEGNLPQFTAADMLVEVALWHGDAVATNLLINGQKIDFR
ncbi:MAG TPA: GDYXXLXY domain-containing protein [Candidatus Nanoarchaeia archaeon]|nr:GDYXXLXY domain-containing protein [Candidatus Nanoarchaeia archaeon]